ncbi:MAG: ImmA/IrrE family metallo-endopeptidase [Treponema sp.]
MHDLLKNCLFVNDRTRFRELKEAAEDFRSEYIGNTIIRDGIFAVLRKYADAAGQELKLLKFPIDDKQVWAYTCIKEGVIFVTINTAIDLSKQVFAAAHELYHIQQYVTKKAASLESLLTKPFSAETEQKKEEQEANAFAALILAPKEQIKEQLNYKGKKTEDADIYDLVSFMDTFAMPYRAMVLKLFECDFFTQEQADSLLKPETGEKIQNYARLHDIGTHWLKPTYDNNINSIQELVELNKKEDAVSETRCNEDIQDIQEIIKSLPVKE